MNKSKLLSHLVSHCEKERDEIQQRILELQADLGSEQKSSAGDKHETGRAMIQLEMEKMQEQILLWDKHLAFCRSLSVAEHPTIQAGSFVQTNRGDFFLGIGLGRIEFSEKSIYCMAMNAPIAQLFLNKSTGESFMFQQKEWVLEQVH